MRDDKSAKHGLVEYNVQCFKRAVADVCSVPKMAAAAHKAGVRTVEDLDLDSEGRKAGGSAS